MTNNNFFRPFGFTSTKFKAFIISFILVFLMVILRHLGLKLPFSWQGLFKCWDNSKVCTLTIVSPLPSQSNHLDKLIPKLSKIKDDFQLSKDLPLVTSVSAESDFDKAKSYAVIDFENGKVLHGKNLSQRLPIASLTKIMAAIVALDLASPAEQFVATLTATQITPTRFALHPGEKLTLEELLQGSLLTSANDCAEIIRQGIDNKYGAPVFIDAMNAKARLIGLKNTHFTNPQGFDNPSNYSSAEDLAILTHLALSKYPLINQIVQKEFAQLPKTPDHQALYMNNWNGLIGVYPGVMGVKIGNTGQADKTTIVVSNRANKKVLVIVLGAPGIIERDLWAARLLDLGFEQLAYLPPIGITEMQLLKKYATWKY